MLKKIIIANWKMNPLTLKDAERLLVGINKELSKIKKTGIVVCPPFVYLEKLRKLSRKVSFGAQDAFWGETGAFTGEVSASMLAEIGVKYVILGHSERRALGESNETINKKLKAAISAGLSPILCIGENDRDENHEYFNFVKNQLLACINGIPKNLLYKIIIAYEPVWAISTTANRRDASPADAKEMAIFIRKILSDKLGTGMKMPRIIYGGSVNNRDAGEFLTQGGVDGLLVGKASLDVKKFTDIIKIAENEND
ncbi:MAG: triose-phosphate isomerase [Candidatus Paceibacterota bacterium]|jgi:triosephosphate isomerase